MACVIREVLDVKIFFCERILSCLTQWFFPERLLSYIFFLLNFAGISLSHFLKQITQVDF